MSIPNLTTSTSRAIIDHERQSAMRAHQNDRCERQEYLTGRYETVIEKLIDQRDQNQATVGAAPVVLAALKKIVFDWDGEAEDMFEAKAAIAKAKGE